MNIAFVCNEYPPAPHGGIGIFVQTLSRQLTNLNQNIFVLGYDSMAPRNRWSEEDGINVLRVKSPFNSVPFVNSNRFVSSLFFFAERLYLSRMLVKVVKKYGVDLVESHDWNGPLWSKPSVPLIVRMHGANTAYQFGEHKKISKLLKFVERRNVSMADALIAVSRYIGNITLKALELDSRDFSVIYNGVDTNLFRPRASVTRKPNEVIYVGSLTGRKGIYALLRAIPLVLKKIPAARFKFVGRLPVGANGEQMTARLLAHLPEWARHVVNFADHIPHVQLPFVYCRATVAVFPSYAEAFGLTCAEAMACGTAVVMTSRASGPELIEPGVSGLLADPDDKEELAGAIIAVLEDAELGQRLGKKARERAVTLFDVARVTKANFQFYQEILNTHKEL